MRCLIFGKGGMSAGIAAVLADHGHDATELSLLDCDVTLRGRVSAALDGHRPDLVVNCAGVSEETAPAATYLHNLYGSHVVVEQAAIGRGIRTVLIASVAGLYGKPGHMAYSASKAGVISLAQSAGFEHPVWAISPGRVDTPMRERDYPNDTPGSRLDPRDVGHIVVRILAGHWKPGTNVLVRKVGLEDIIVKAHTGDGWREELRVGEPVTI